jgi:hypothetical protein
MTGLEHLSDEELVALYSQKQKSPKMDIGDFVQQPKEQSIGRTILDQGLSGATLNFGDEAADLIGSAYAKLMRPELFQKESVADIYSAARKTTPQRLAQQQEQNPITSILSNVGGAIATAPAMLAGAAPLATTKVGQAISSATLPTAVGRGVSNVGKVAGAGYLTAGVGGFGGGSGSFEQRLEKAQEDAPSGAAFNLGVSGVKNIVIPIVSETLKPLAKRAKQLGIDLSITQVAPSRARGIVQKLSQNLPFSGVDAFQEKQAIQWNKAVAKTLGVDADNLSPETIVSFKANNSKKFDNALKGKIIKPDNNFSQQLDNIVKKAKDSISPDFAQVVQNRVNMIKNELFQQFQKEGLEFDAQNILRPKITTSNKAIPLSGEKLSSIRSSLLQDLPTISGDARGFVSDIISNIDDLAGKTLNEAERKILNQARREYRNFKILEPLLENSPTGAINPTQLLSRVASNKYTKGATSQIGKDDLVDLAKIGKQFLPKLGGSDTIPNAMMLKAAGVGGVAGSAAFDPTVAVSTGVAFTGNRAYQSLYNQAQPVVNKVIDGVDNVQTPIIGSVIGAQQSQSNPYETMSDDELIKLYQSKNQSQPAFDTPNNPDGVSPQQEPLTLDITPQSYNTQMQAPRGLRNNNPANLKGNDLWLGKTGVDEGGFIQFKTPQAGSRAMAINLANQEKKHGINTVSGLISKYAPNSENDTVSYIEKVANDLGVKPNQKIKLTDKKTMLKLMKTMITVENGNQPYSNQELLQAINAGISK